MGIILKKYRENAKIIRQIRREEQTAWMRHKKDLCKKEAAYGAGKTAV